MENCLYCLSDRDYSVHRGWGKFWVLSTVNGIELDFPHMVVHISTICGGIVDYSYRALMLALMSLMTSATSGLVLMSFSIRSMECMTVE